VGFAMIFRSIFIIILVSGLVWLRFHNEGKETPQITLPSLSDASDKISKEVLNFCAENPDDCQNALKKLTKTNEPQ
jgi:hypothetical protein